ISRRLLTISLLTILLFFSLLPPPPTSPLFPYTTLFRSPRATFDSFTDDVGVSRIEALQCRHGAVDPVLHQLTQIVLPSLNAPWRSEEHTSELQSRGHLVCRLLLEKKKKTINQITKTSTN